jgi:hypothetical protein
MFVFETSAEMPVHFNASCRPHRMKIVPVCSWATIVNHRIDAMFGRGNSAASSKAGIFKEIFMKTVPCNAISAN